MTKTALFTGGGSAGHVTPNIALIKRLQAEGWNIHYAGTADGIEKQLIAGVPGVTYHTISSGKLRRYFSLKNFTDPFRVLKGIGEAKKLVKTLKPDVVFSKGGFVSVPVVLGAKNRCPVLVHESDYTPGLANRIANRYADRVLVTFEDTLAHVKGGRGVFTGTPIRAELFAGSRERGFAFTGLTDDKPILLMMGGSLGAQAVNEALRAALPQLLPHFHIIHLCGKGKLDENAVQPGYLQYEYISEELPDLFAMSDILLSRAGANAVFEFLALKKPAVLVPLPLSASRGDQILNATYFQKKGFAKLLPQEELNADTLAAALKGIYHDRRTYMENMDREQNADGTDAVLNCIRQAAERGQR